MVKASFAVNEMMAKSSWPFTKGLFIKKCLLKTKDILYFDQKKLFEIISLSPNTVICRIPVLLQTRREIADYIHLLFIFCYCVLS